MNTRILLSAALLSISATNVSAAPKISMANDNFETKICYTAATQGLEAAKQLVSDKGLSFRKFEKNVTCNDQDLSTFASNFNKLQNDQAGLPQVKLVATNKDVESKICLESLTHGIPQTAAKYKINKDYVRCNGKPLPRFVDESRARGATVAALPNN